MGISVRSCKKNYYNWRMRTVQRQDIFDAKCKNSLDENCNPVPICTRPLPLLHVSEVGLLSDDKLEEYLSSCMYCSARVEGVDNRAAHLNTYHDQEHNGTIKKNCFLILKHHKEGQLLNFSPLQQEAVLMNTLAIVRKNDNNSSLEQIQYDVLYNNVLISPEYFAKIFSTLDVKDVMFGKILKVLRKSCMRMHHNPPELIGNFFLSTEFFNLFVKINAMADQIWLLRLQHPELKKEWRWKHRRIYDFRSKLLEFLEKIFGTVWVQEFTTSAEQLRAKIQRMG